MPLAIIYPVVMHLLIGERDAAERDRGNHRSHDKPITTSAKVADVLVGLLGIGICVFASTFAIVTWPTSH